MSLFIHKTTHTVRLNLILTLYWLTFQEELHNVRSACTAKISLWWRETLEPWFTSWHGNNCFNSRVKSLLFWPLTTLTRNTSTTAYRRFTGIVTHRTKLSTRTECTCGIDRQATFRWRLPFPYSLLLVSTTTSVHTIYQMIVRDIRCCFWWKFRPCLI